MPTLPPREAKADDGDENQSRDHSAAKQQHSAAPVWHRKMIKQECRANECRCQKQEHCDHALSQSQEEDCRLRNTILMQQDGPGYALAKHVEEQQAADKAVNIGPERIPTR